MGNDFSVVNIDIQKIENWMRDFVELNGKTYIANGDTEGSDVVRYIKQGERIVEETRNYLQEINDNHNKLIQKIKQYQLFIEDIKEFIHEHNFVDLADRKVMNWLIALLFPSLSGSLCKLVYDMHGLGKVIIKLEND